MFSNGTSERTPSAARLATKQASTIARGKNTRAKTTNKPRRFPVSGRTALGRRMFDLADQYAGALGGWSGLSDLMTGNIRRAAELVALSEQTRADALRNGNVDPLALVRLDNAASRAVRLLMLDHPRESEPMTLAEHLASFGAQEARTAREAAGRGGTAARPRNPPHGRGTPRQRANDGPTSNDGGRRR
jgi:hypothetical protein